MNQYDLALRDTSGRLVAIVEIKNATRLSRDLATGFRRNLVAHTFLPEESAFLLLSQDRGFIWKKDKRALESEPDDEFSMQAVVEHYAPTFSGRRLAERELEMVVYSWLSDIINGQAEPARPADAAVLSLGLARDVSVDLGVAV
jgi:hypothetical protein